MDYRLKNEKDFNKVFKNGKRLYSSSLTLIYLEKPDKEEIFKVGYAVGKKHGGSVIRNKIKRFLRESFRSFMPDIRKNFFFVFIPKIKEDKKDYSFFEFKKDMEYLLRKGNFIEEQC